MSDIGSVLRLFVNGALGVMDHPSIILQRIRGVTIMRYINLHFTYLLTYFK